MIRVRGLCCNSKCKNSKKFQDIVIFDYSGSGQYVGFCRNCIGKAVKLLEEKK